VILRAASSNMNGDNCDLMEVKQCWVWQVWKRCTC